MNKEVKINFRIFAYEKKLLQSKIKKAKMKLSDFCRKAVFEKEILHIEGISDCIYELNKINNNINQLAIAANQGRNVVTTIAAVKIFKTLDKIDSVLGG